MEIDDVIARTYALYDQHPALTVPVHLADAAPVAHGWYMLVRNSGRAALVLEESGMGLESTPLRRSMIEHGLALTWLAARPDEALTALARKSQHTAGKMRAVMADGWQVPAEVFEAIAAPIFEPSTEDKNLNFTQLATEFNHNDLRVVWMHQSAYCHPSLTGAQAYLALGTSGTESAPMDVHEDAGDVRVEVALLLLIASDGFNRFMDGQPWRVALDELAEGLKAVIAARKEGALGTSPT